MSQRRYPPCIGRPHQVRGIALLIVLVLLLVIGLTTGVAMRQAVTTQRIGASLRLDSLAQQSAETALRVCEDEILKPVGQREPALSDVETLAGMPIDQLRWPQAGWWDATPPQAGQVAHYVLPVGTTPGAAPPQCLVERMVTPNGQTTVVVTARGFSPGYAADAANGRTLSGSSVWLQSFLYFE